MNFLAIGITEFFSRNATSRRVDGLIEWNAPLIGSYSCLVYFTLLLMVGSAVFLFKTPWGLRLRAAGESTEALNTLGLSRARLQYVGVALRGVFAALGGCFLASEAHYFTKGMTAGRGIRRSGGDDFRKLESVQDSGGMSLVRMRERDRSGKLVASASPALTVPTLSADHGGACRRHRQIKAAPPVWANDPVGGISRSRQSSIQTDVKTYQRFPAPVKRKR